MNILQLIKKSNSKGDLHHLKTELSGYGLRPDDWVLKQTLPDQFKIENLSEPTFCFNGKTEYKNGRRQWGSITLAEI
jgi:hypothetical protein